ncbi:Type I restriction enzyme M protein [Desulfonema limicola]|uniref:Type I restriction enzyme M protein n=1 Tax=Desulfonema limicola TaxID=45656 RepID=A0A975B429_9BACT|nr:N-6 DNA methylase [Desulfonema limicola]QTA78425.1 Type I restriction enzyme M protein [Desulfonema limicola]
MAKKKKKTEGLASVIDRMEAKLKELGYTDIVRDLPLVEIDPDQPVVGKLAAMDGDDVVIFCYPVASGQAQEVAVQDEGVFYSRLITGDRVAHFVWVGDDEFDYFYDSDKNTSIAEIPGKETWQDVVRGMSDDRKKHLIELSEEFARGNWRYIQKKFDHLHERLYPSGGFSSANEAIDEICRIMFIKAHLERNNAYVLQTLSGNKRLSDVFHADNIRKYKEEAVQDMKAAFKELAALPEYIATDLTGAKNSIFPPDDYLRLNNPENLAYAVELFQDIRLVPDQKDKKRVHEDLLGWAYDVFLRGKYDGSGGLATYLTPSQVTECMAQIAFHDIDKRELWAGFQGMNKPKSKPGFLMGDITCGTGRFLIAAMKCVKDRVFDTIGKNDEEKRWWLEQMKRYSFFGADQAEGSLIKARLNMLLYGDGHSQLLRVQDSIMDQHIDRLIGKFDLIMTNPPFGKGSYDAAKGDNYKNGLEKMRSNKDFYDPDVRGLLDNPRYQCELGWSWRADRNKKKVLAKADPASLFIDRNLQLLKPGGRLLIVVPDGILCNSGDKYIREYIMGQKDEETGEFFGGKAVVKAVVSLPTQTFALGGTGAKTSFIYVQKKGTYYTGNKSITVDNQGPIFMAVAEHVGFIKKGKKDEKTDPMGNDLQPIAEAYCKG